MRLVILLILIVYFIGVGVELAPIFQSGWANLSASDLSANVLHALPDALAWPAHVYRSVTGGASAPTKT